MSSVTNLFFAVSSFSCHNLVSLFVSYPLDSCCDSFFFWSPSICVATSIPCRDLTVLPFTEFYVGTLFSCRDTISVASHFDSWSQLAFYVATSFVCLLPLFKLRLKTSNMF